MKLRIQGNSIRLRLTQPEVSSISQLKKVKETTQFGGGSLVLTYSLTTHTSSSSIVATFNDGEIKVSVPSQMAISWATTEQVGIEAYLPVENGESLHVLIEKDFQCLHRDEQEEPNQFPNPAASADDKY